MHENPVAVCGVERRVRVRQSVGIFVDLDAVGGMRGMEFEGRLVRGGSPQNKSQNPNGRSAQERPFLLSFCHSWLIRRRVGLGNWEEFGAPLPPSSGSIQLFGHDVTRLPPHRRAALGMARTFQITNLVGRLTARHNVVLALQGRTSRKFALFRPLRACISRCRSPAGTMGIRRHSQGSRFGAGLRRSVFARNPAGGMSAAAGALARRAHGGFVAA
jgi:hypothetical protein